MKQKIKLTKENDGTIHVDDVEVCKGVYGVSKIEEVFYVQTIGEAYVLADVNLYDTDYYINKNKHTLKELIKTYTFITFHTLSDLRIVTEKELSVEDLKDGDHVGFINLIGAKGFVQRVEGYFIMLKDDGYHWCGAKSLSLISAIKSTPQSVDLYRFTTRKELYAWLAE